MKDKKPKIMDQETEQRLRAEQQTLDLIREAHRHPIEPNAELVAKHRLSPSERLAPFLAVTPQPVLDRLEQVSADRDQLVAELVEKNRIIERLLRAREGQRAGGKVATATPLLRKNWREIWDAYKARNPNWTIKRLDEETAFVCKVSEFTVKAARLKAKKDETDP